MFQSVEANFDMIPIAARMQFRGIDSYARRRCFYCQFFQSQFLRNTLPLFCRHDRFHFYGLNKGKNHKKRVGRPTPSIPMYK